MGRGGRQDGEGWPARREHQQPVAGASRVFCREVRLWIVGSERERRRASLVSPRFTCPHPPEKSGGCPTRRWIEPSWPLTFLDRPISSTSRERRKDEGGRIPVADATVVPRVRAGRLP